MREEETGSGRGAEVGGVGQVKVYRVFPLPPLLARMFLISSITVTPLFCCLG